MTALPLALILAVAAAVTYSIGMAQVIWGYFGLVLAMALGPIFIPWVMVPQMSWLFWGWLKTVIQYSFYTAVAAAIFRVTSELGVATIGNLGETPVLTEPTGVGNLCWTT